MTHIRLTLALLLALSSGYASADVEEDGKIWSALFLQGDTGIEHLRWTVEFHTRQREEGSENDTFIFRPSLNYALSPKLSVGAGYAFVETYPDGADDVQEHRLFQQVTYTHHQPDSFTLTSRSRLEERWRNQDSDQGYRLRQLIRATLPLQPAPGFSLVLWDELFINLNETDWGARSGFDNNRAFMGLGYAFGQDYKLEIGYMNQYVRQNGDDRSNHILSTTLQVDY